MGLKDRIIPVPGLLHQKCRSRCRDRSERSNNPGAGTITQEVPLPLPGPEPLPFKLYIPLILDRWDVYRTVCEGESLLLTKHRQVQAED